MGQTSLRAAWDEGAKAHPSVPLAFEIFEQHYACLLCHEHEDGWQRFASDLYLACACAQGEQTAVELLERQWLPRATHSIRRVDPNPEFVDETLQVLRQRLLVGPKAKLREYSGRGPLGAWLAIVAARTAVDEARSQRTRFGHQPLHEGDLWQRLADGRVDPELALTKGRYAAPFRGALLHAIDELCSEDRNLLRMYLVSHCSLSQIARAYAVHRATAARRLVRARGLVFESVRRHLRAQSGDLTDREFASIARAVQSQLDVDLIACLGDAPADTDSTSIPESAARTTA